MGSWIYPALDRCRRLPISITPISDLPWTRASITHTLNQTAEFQDFTSKNDQAYEIYLAVRKELTTGTHKFADLLPLRNNFESPIPVSAASLEPPLRDRFHLGLTNVNDSGRPYHRGFNPIAGFSTRSEAGQFALYFRGEYQHAPGAAGYSQSLSNILSTIDGVPIETYPKQSIIPRGKFGSRVLDRVNRISLHPSNSIRSARNLFAWHGLLFFSLPSLRLEFIARTPLAGQSGMRFGIFLLLDGLGSRMQREDSNSFATSRTEEWPTLEA